MSTEGTKMLLTDCPKSKCSLKILEATKMPPLSQGSFTEKKGTSRPHFFGLLFSAASPSPIHEKKTDKSSTFIAQLLYMKSLILYASNTYLYSFSFISMVNFGMFRYLTLNGNRIPVKNSQLKEVFNSTTSVHKLMQLLVSRLAHPKSFRNLATQNGREIRQLLEGIVL